MEKEKLEVTLKERLRPLLGSLGEKAEFEEILSTHKNMVYLRIKTPQGNYVAKKYLGYEGNGDSYVLRDKISKNPAGFEYDLLNLYSEEGAHVPTPFINIQKESVLVMTDIGEDTLEKRLEKADEKTAVSLLEKVMKELLNLHMVAERTQGLLVARIPAKLFGVSDFEKRAIKYYRELLASDSEIIRNRIPRRPESEEKEFLNLIKIVTNNVYQNAQLVHGDMTTYHVAFIKDEEGKEAIYFFDFGSPKFLPVTFDCAELVFSPGWNAPVEKRIAPFGEYVEKEKKLEQEDIRRIGITWTDRSVFVEAEKKLLFSGIFECLRCSTKSRIKRIKDPEEFQIYSKKHPAYASAVPHYRQMCEEITSFLLKNSGEYGVKHEEAKRIEEKLRPKLYWLISQAEEKPAPETTNENNPAKNTTRVGNITKFENNPAKNTTRVVASQH